MYIWRVQSLYHSIPSDVNPFLAYVLAMPPALAQQTSYSSIPTSNIVEESISRDGLVLSLRDHAGVISGLEVQVMVNLLDGESICSSFYRHFMTSGTEAKHRDGRGNVTTIRNDIAGLGIKCNDGAAKKSAR